MNLEVLRNFITVAKCRSFSCAADLLFISQPTLSRQIAELEASLGVKLFERHYKRVDLTEAGGIFLDSATNICQTYEKTRMQVSALSEKNQLLKVGYQRYSVDLNILAAAAKRLMESHPSFDLQFVRCRPTDLMQELERHSIDVCFANRHLTNGKKDLRIETIAREKILLAISDALPLSKESSISLAQLRDMTLILPKAAAAGSTFDFFESILEENNVRVNKKIYTSDLSEVFLTIQVKNAASLLPSAYRNSAPAGIKFLDISGMRVSQNFDVTMIYSPENSNPLIPLFQREIIKAMNLRDMGRGS